MKPVVITPRWRGPLTKRTERVRIETTARLCAELGRPKPLVRLPKGDQK